MSQSPSLGWKDKLYASYVTTGQAGSNGSVRPALDLREFVYFQHVIRNHLDGNRDQRVLDLGCGHGLLLFCLKAAGYSNIVGIDVSAEQVALAKYYGVTEVVQGDLFNFSSLVGEEPIDVVFLMDVVEHLTREEIFRLFELIESKMRSGGTLILHVPNAQAIFGNVVRYGDMTHEMAFTPSSMRQSLSCNGFSDIQIYEDRPLLCSWKSFLRRVIWVMGTLPFRILYAAETGVFPQALSQNMLVIAKVLKHDSRAK